jgi:hypothetical protein
LTYKTKPDQFPTAGVTVNPYGAFTAPYAKTMRRVERQPTGWFAGTTNPENRGNYPPCSDRHERDQT